jgi:hypothetical protein
MAYINKNGTENAIFLVNEQLGRTISIGSSWTRIRVGILACVMGTGSISLISPKFAIGLTAGSSSLFLDTTTRHFVGMTNQSGDTWSALGAYLAGTGNPCYQAVKSGSTELITGSHFFFAFGAASSTASLNRQSIYLDFIKGAGDPSIWDMRLCCETTFDGGTFARDTSVSTFYDQLPAETASIAGGATVSTRLPVSESIRGTLDTINISWNNTRSFAVHEVAVYRFS